MQHDFYRPAGFHYFKGGLDDDGKLIAWQDHFVTFGQGGKLGQLAPTWTPTNFPRGSLPNWSYGQSLMQLGMPTGPMRAPGSNALAFVYQSFIDELAHAAGQGPAAVPPRPPGRAARAGEFDRPPDALRDFDTGRMRGVLDRVRGDVRLGQRAKLPARTGMGVAFYFSHLGYFAEVVQARSAPIGDIKVDKVWVAGDVGQPDHQPQRRREPGAGRGARRRWAGAGPGITIERGRVVQTNFTRSSRCA